jgi:hypothetical protein
MQYSAAEQVLISTLQAAWPGQAIPTPIAYENVNFDPDDATYTAPYPPAGPWIMPEIFWSGEQPLSMGTPGQNWFKGVGIMLVHCNAPQAQGRSTASAIFDQVASIFRGNQYAVGTSGNVLIPQVRPVTGDIVDAKAGPYWRITAQVTVYYTDLG